MGLEGFVWFVGVVEDRMDPEKLNRVRVRCYGFHSDDKSDIPTEDLPWASCIVTPTNPAAYSPKEGDWVVGFFMDAYDAQQPVIMGVLPGKPKTRPPSDKGFSDPNGKYPEYLSEPTTTRLARGDTRGTVIETRKKQRKTGVRSTKIGGRNWNEPAPEYGAKYPYNYAHETESGHAFELDDTKGKERVHLAHKIGTATEFTSKGDRVDHIVKDRYSVVMGSDFMYVKGSCSITVDGDCNMKIGGKWNVEAAEINICAQGHVKIKGGSKTQIEAGGAMDLKAGGAMKVGGGGKASFGGSKAVIYGAKIDLAGAINNIPGGSPSTPSGTGLSAGGASGFVQGAAIGTPEWRDALGKGLIDIAGNPIPGITGGLSGIDLGGLTGDLAGQLGQSQFASLTKQVAGITSSINQSIGQAQNLINQGNNLLNQNLAIGQLENGLQTVEAGLNNLSGDLQNATVAQFKSIQDQTTQLVQSAADQGVTINLDPINSVNLAGPVDPNQYVANIGKQLYPKTETVPVPTANTG